MDWSAGAVGVGGVTIRAQKHDGMKKKCLSVWWGERRVGGSELGLPVGSLSGVPDEAYARLIGRSRTAYGRGAVCAVAIMILGCYIC